MIDKAFKENIDDISGKTDINAAKLFYEFKYKTVMEASTKLTQFSLVFFSVSTFITAITTFTNFDNKTRTVAIYSMIVMILAFSVIGIAIMYGVVTGLLHIRETLKSISLDTYNNLNMDGYFKRGITVLSIVSIVSVFGVISIAAIIFYEIKIM